MSRTEYQREYYRKNAEKLRPKAAERKRWARLSKASANARSKLPDWYIRPDGTKPEPR